MVIYGCLIAIIILLLGCLIYCAPHIRQNIKLDEEIKYQNELLKKEMDSLVDEIQSKKNEIEALDENIKKNQETAEFWKHYLSEQ